jgi:8-oxo-dGTP pyrophosphatase MutT (NUDIX family)
LAERVRAILFADNQVILIKRVKPNKPIYWVAPGGGVEPNETHHQALERELYEELGAQIEINQQVLVVTQMGIFLSV